MQRVKFFWFVWQYSRVFSLPTLSFSQKISLLNTCIKVDWYVAHAHHPSEMIDVLTGLASRKANAGEIMVEAGCYNGGSTIKFSVVCKMLGYKLQVYDSFEGVETMTKDELAQTGHNYSGEYAVGEEIVRANVSKYGEIGVCSFYKGWFADTLAAHPLNEPVKIVYIDCDVAKGTFEVLQGTLHSLVKDGIVYSQDYTIRAVKNLIHNPETWSKLNVSPPAITPTHNKTAFLTWK